MLRRLLAATILTIAGCAPAGATQICAWMTETNEFGHERQLDLWLSGDTPIDFIYMVTGRGVATVSGDAFSPLTSTFHLDPGQPRKAWSFSTALYPPAKIDITLEIHKMPSDIYSNAPTPLLAKIPFKREIPASETNPPDTLAQKQCMEIVTGGLPL
jgi:hypothetical protein